MSSDPIGLGIIPFGENWELRWKGDDLFLNPKYGANYPVYKKVVRDGHVNVTNIKAFYFGVNNEECVFLHKGDGDKIEVYGCPIGECRVFWCYEGGPPFTNVTIPHIMAEHKGQLTDHETELALETMERMKIRTS